MLQTKIDDLDKRSEPFNLMLHLFLTLCEILEVRHVYGRLCQLKGNFEIWALASSATVFHKQVMLSQLKPCLEPRYKTGLSLFNPPSLGPYSSRCSSSQHCMAGQNKSTTIMEWGPRKKAVSLVCTSPPGQPTPSPQMNSVLPF